MTPEQLRTLVAVVETGTLEAAARQLVLTPSAVSQRIKALEREVGRLVVRRTVPASVTPAGEILLRAARAMQVVEDETASALHAAGMVPSVVSVAVNADSLATWFADVIAAVAEWEDLTLRVLVRDEGRTSDLLRDGSVLAAVTADPVAVRGCRVDPLGTMRYRPVGLHAWSGRGWTGRPLVSFGADDDLHRRILRDGDPRPVRVHHIPSAEACLAAIRAGLGWGVVPEQQAPSRGAAELVVLGRRRSFDRPLFWQSVRLPTERLDRLSAVVTGAARRSLRRTRPE